MSQKLLTTRKVAALLRISPETALRWYRAGKLPGNRASLAARKREEHLHRHAVSSGHECAAVRQSREEREPEATLNLRASPLLYSPSAMVCDDHGKLVADLLDAHLDNAWVALRVSVLHSVGNGFADAELYGPDLVARESGLACKARNNVTERRMHSGRATALTCNVVDIVRL